jgi:glycerol kinase
VRSAPRCIDGENLRAAANTTIHQATVHQALKRFRVASVVIGRLVDGTIPADTMGGQGLHNTVCRVWNNSRGIRVVNPKTQDATVGSGVE